MMISKFTATCFLTLAFMSGAIAADRAKVPSEAELKTLTRDSLLAFNKAVAAKDFNSFFAQISKLWQEQVTPEKLAEIFKSFIEQQIDLAVVATAEPIFDKPPAIDNDGVLLLDGNYATKPNKVQFRLNYIYEKPAWKLIGINLNVTPADAASAPLPSEKEMRALIQDSLGNFNRAVQKKDFDDFYVQISALWQKQTTAAKLQGLFQSFIDQEIDLTPVLKLPPVFDEAPAINEDGILNVKGTLSSKAETTGGLPTPGEKVQFELGYVFEAPAWKLVKINVHVTGDEADKSE